MIMNLFHEFDWFSRAGIWRCGVDDLNFRLVSQIFSCSCFSRYHEIYSDVIPDLRSSTITGRQHFFWGVHACTLRWRFIRIDYVVLLKHVLLDLRARSSEFDKLHRPFQKIIYCNPKRSKSMNFTLKPDKDVFPLEWSTVHSHKKILKLNLFVTLKYQFYSLKWSLFVKLPGPVIIYRRGLGEGGFEAKQGEIYPIPPLNVSSLKWSHLITFDDFRDPPPMSSFSKQIWVVSPLNPSKTFSDLPLLGSQLRLISPLVLPKIKWSPLKSPSLPPGDK